MTIKRLWIKQIFFATLFSYSSAVLAQSEDLAPETGEPQDTKTEKEDSPTTTDPASVTNESTPGESTPPSPPTPPTSKTTAGPPAPPTETVKATQPPPSPATSAESEAVAQVDSAPVLVPGRGLRIAGASVLGGGYGASALLGIALLDIGSGEGGLYLIPLIGGYLLGGTLANDVSDGKLGTFLMVSFPSIVQTTGLIILIVGLNKERKWKKEQENKATASFVPFGPNGSTGFSISGRF